jgi:glycine oxidase
MAKSSEATFLLFYADCYKDCMKTSGDVIILGGGVIGLTTAYYLAREGVSVIICERGSIGKEASWAGAGILSPSHPEHAQYPFDRLRAMSFVLFPDLSRELKALTGIDNEFHRCGAFQFVNQIDEANDHEWSGLGVTTKIVAENDVVALEPALASGLGSAIEIPDTAQLRNPRHIQALHEACVRSGLVTFLEGTSANEILVENGRVKGVRTTGEVLSGGAVLVATGAWADHLLEPLGCRLKIEPVRGQIVLLNAGEVTFHRILVWGSRYMVPRLDGRVLVGSTEEHAGFDKTPTADAIASLHELAVRLVPRLAKATVEQTWAGLRPGSPDGLPFLGRAPGIENLFVAAGHFRSGIQLSPGTGIMLKEMILDQPLSMPMDAFRLDRWSAIKVPEGINDVEFERIERELGVRLPRDFRDALATRSDLRALTHVLAGVVYPYFLDSLYLEPNDLVRANTLERKPDAATQYVFPGWWRDYLIIGSDGAGDYFCLRLDNSPGVWFLCNDSGEISLPYGSLGEYIEMLLEQYRSEQSGGPDSTCA